MQSQLIAVPDQPIVELFTACGRHEVHGLGDSPYREPQTGTFTVLRE